MWAMIESYIFAAAVFGTVASLTWWIARAVAHSQDARLRERLRNPEMDVSVARTVLSRLGEWGERFSQMVSIPFMPTTPEGQNALRRRLGFAGMYGAAASTLFAGAKVLCLGLGVVLGTAAGLLIGQGLLGFSFGGILGYLVPGFWLHQKISANRLAMERALPDALDLLVVCVESGLTIDASMQKVGHELRLPHPRLSQEFEITHMETRVGVPRSEALRNLGRRTGSGPLQALGSMLIQAERFGTSIASALRIHSESMRISRQHAAEEIAAKASVKLSFPVVLFIFPAVLIVLGGPALIGLFKSALFTN